MGRFGGRIGVIEALDVLDRDAARRSRSRSCVVARARASAGCGTFRTPAWMWLGGLMGLTVVSSITFAQPRIGATAVIGILIAGQLVMGAVIDRFGLFGVDQIGISPAAGGRHRAAGNRRGPLARSVARVEERQGLDRPGHGLRDLGVDVPRDHYAGETIPPLFAASTRFITSGTIMAAIVLAARRDAARLAPRARARAS